MTISDMMGEEEITMIVQNVSSVVDRWLLEQLSKGPCSGSELRAAAKALGYSETSVYASATRLGVVSERAYASKHRTWRLG